MRQIGTAGSVETTLRSGERAVEKKDKGADPNL